MYSYIHADESEQKLIYADGERVWSGTVRFVSSVRTELKTEGSLAEKQEKKTVKIERDVRKKIFISVFFCHIFFLRWSGPSLLDRGWCMRGETLTLTWLTGCCAFFVFVFSCVLFLFDLLSIYRCTVVCFVCFFCSSVL